jgi:DNA modification methylase
MNIGKHQMLPIEQLVPWDKNPRFNDNAVQAVADSITEFGFASPIVIRKANNMIICGHTRWKASQKLGISQVPCIIMDLDSRSAERLAIADNKVGGLATFDDIKLQEIFATFDEEDFNGLGFTEHELGEFFDVPDIDPDDEEVVIDPDRIPITEKGDIWILGNHRLMCGDATSIDDVKELLDGETVDLFLTDPPYNVSYVGKTKDALTIQNDAMVDSDFRKFLVSAFDNANAVMKAGASYYIWHADSEGYNFRGACKDVGWTVRQCLIWVKQIFVMGRQDYHWRHEPCLYGWKEGAGHSWYADRKQDTILEFDRPMSSREHPTMKPLRLFEYQMKNNTQKGDKVLDLFGGSGTTLIVSENNNRVSYTMELDPIYCDVIVERWEKKVGTKAHTIKGKFADFKSGEFKMWSDNKIEKMNKE